jgi:hypothetical protein
MVSTTADNYGAGEGKWLPGFGGTIFLQQGAHVTVLDGNGRIIAVNDAWQRFGRENGLDAAYRFVGASYPEVCERAIGAERGGEGAREALDGITRVLGGAGDRFSLVYPCHAPQQQRWFLMYVRPIGEKLDGAVVSHIDVTSLHLGGFVPDETSPTPDAPSTQQVSGQLSRMLFGGGHDPLASIGSRLR